MSLRAKYTGDGIAVYADGRRVLRGQVVADDDSGDVTASSDTIRELLARADFTASAGEPKKKKGA